MWHDALVARNYPMLVVTIGSAAIKIGCGILDQMLSVTTTAMKQGRPPELDLTEFKMRFIPRLGVSNI